MLNKILINLNNAKTTLISLDKMNPKNQCSPKTTSKNPTKKTYLQSKDQIK